jgi:hypothetical protein
MASAKQLSDTSFILVPAGAVRPAGVCSRHCIVLHRLQRGVTSEVGEEVVPRASMPLYVVSPPVRLGDRPLLL